MSGNGDGAAARPTWSGAVRPALHEIVDRLRRVPFTLGLLAVFLVTGAVTGSYLNGPPESLLQHAGVSLAGLRSGNWWSLFTSLFFATNPLAYLSASLMILFLAGLAERTLGTARTAAVFFAGQFGCVTFFLLVAQLAEYAGDGWLGPMTGDTVIGPYGPVLTVCVAATGRLSVMWKRRLRAAVLSVSVMLVLYVGHAEAVIGLLGALLGLALSWWNRPGNEERYRHPPTGREIRHLLALTVSVFAIGPLLSATARTPVGPLALLRDIVTNPFPSVDQMVPDCWRTIQAACLGTSHGFTGQFGLALAVVPVILLLICADGMRRGRRLALQIAILIQVGVTVLASTYLALFALLPANASRTKAAPLDSVFAHFLPLIVVPLLLAVILLLSRRHFRVGTPLSSRRKLIAVVGSTFLGLAAIYSSLWLAAGGMSRDGGLLGLLSELSRQYLPVPVSPRYHRIFAARDGLEESFFTISGPLFWLVALVGVWWVLLVRPRGRSGADDRTAARHLLRQGGGSLSWMALWEPNVYWFGRDGRGAIAYQQHGNVALTLGGPFGHKDSYPAVVQEFLAYCNGHALIPALYSCDGTHWPALREKGFHRVAVAQETRLAVRKIEFKGKEWQNVRTALNRAAKLEVKAVWSTYQELPVALRSRLSEVSESWAAGKPVPEMGFTLGGVDQLDDDDVLCCLAVGADGTVHGITSWLPVYDGGTLASRTLDVMRRGADAFPGVMEFLIASAILELRKSVEVISLSGSPLAHRPDEAGELAAPPARNLAAILEVVGQALEPVYGFRSLAAFKSRFKPEYQALYLYYQDPLHLPALGRALTRAYLPGLSLRHGARFLGHLVRQGS